MSLKQSLSLRLSRRAAAPSDGEEGEEEEEGLEERESVHEEVEVVDHGIEGEGGGSEEEQRVPIQSVTGVVDYESI